MRNYFWWFVLFLSLFLISLTLILTAETLVAKIVSTIPSLTCALNMAKVGYDWGKESR